MFVMPAMSDLVVRGVRNLNGIEYEMAQNVNALDVIMHKYIIIQKSSLDVLKNTFLAEEAK